MEGKDQMDTYSFTSELFGSKESLPPSSGIFDSIFSPPSPKVLGSSFELKGKMANDKKTSKVGTQDGIFKGYGGKSQSLENKDMSSIYQDQMLQPCTLSSSIYYGGQDLYIKPHSAENARSNSLLYKKDGEEDDSGMASRGNWWQGGLYY